MGEARRTSGDADEAYCDAETVPAVVQTRAGDPLDLFEEIARSAVSIDPARMKRPASRVPLRRWPRCGQHARFLDVDPNIESIPKTSPTSTSCGAVTKAKTPDGSSG